MYGPAGGGSRAGAAGGTELPLPHPSRAESTSEGNRLPDHGPPDAVVGGRLRRQPPSGSGPRPGTTRPEAVQIGRARLNSSHSQISYAVFCLKKKKKKQSQTSIQQAASHTQ